MSERGVRSSGGGDGGGGDLVPAADTHQLCELEHPDTGDHGGSGSMGGDRSDGTIVKSRSSSGCEEQGQGHEGKGASAPMPA